MATTTPLVGSAEARALRWLPNAALDALADRAAPAWQAWCERWGLSGATLAAHNAGDPHGRALASDTTWHAAPAASVRVGGTPDEVQCLGRALFGTEGAVRPAGALPALARAVVDDALTDLAAALSVLGDEASASLATPASAATPSQPPAAELRMWSGAAVLMLSARDDAGVPVDLRVHLPAALVARHAPATAFRSGERRGALTSLATALSHRTVRLRVVLDPVPVTLGALQALQPGDVLTLTHALDRPLRLEDATDAPEPRLFCQAWLGARGDGRAVELVRFLASNASSS